MEGRCEESNREENEVYPATFGNEEKTGLKLDKRRSTSYCNSAMAYGVTCYLFLFFIDTIKPTC